MKRTLLVGLILALGLSACSAFSPQVDETKVEDGVVTIFAEDG